MNDGSYTGFKTEVFLTFIIIITALHV